MERLENLTMTQLATANKQAETEGYKDTQSVENVPEGSCSANIVINGKGANKSPAFSLIKFERKDAEGNELKLKFEAVKLDVLHVSTGKSYNGIFAKLTPELKTALTKPENQTKEILLESVSYPDKQGRKRTILKFDSISK